ncbi:MAG: DUF4845 domain-containing protein [Cellvibrionaceae bacterium]
MKLASRQGGWSVNQLLVWIVILGLSLNVFFKLGPVYLDNYSSVRAALDSLGKEDLTSYKKSQIKSKLDKFLMVNNVRGAAAEAFRIEKHMKGGYKITANYEVRVNMWGNLDAVMVFENELLTKNTPVTD